MKTQELEIISNRDIMCEYCLDGLNNILYKINMHSGKFIRPYTINT